MTGGVSHERRKMVPDSETGIQIYVHSIQKKTDTERYVGRGHGCSWLLVIGRNVSVVVVGDGQRP